MLQYYTASVSQSQLTLHTLNYTSSFSVQKTCPASDHLLWFILCRILFTPGFWLHRSRSKSILSALAVIAMILCRGLLSSAALLLLSATATCTIRTSFTLLLLNVRWLIRTDNCGITGGSLIRDGTTFVYMKIFDIAPSEK